MMKQIFLYIIIIFYYGINALGQNVYIPDANFKSYLLSHTGINSNLDTAIQVTEANNFNGSLFVENLNISDLTGIEAFLNLKVLHCYNNQLTSLDVSNCSELTELACGYNQLTSLNVSTNSKIKTLSALYNQLMNIDVSSIDSLTSLAIQNNQINSINLNNNLKLYSLYISQNNISNLNLSNNPLINTLEIKKTLISNLDLSPNSNLQLLFLDSNSTLSTLNLKNGNNTFIFSSSSTPSFLGNPNLNCIEVDDSSYSTNNWTNIDAHHFFSENCATSIHEINKNDWLTIYPNPTNSNLTIKMNAQLQEYPILLELTDINGKVVLQQNLLNNSSVIDVSNLQKGFYNVSLQKNTSVFVVKKLMVTH